MSADELSKDSLLTALAASRWKVEASEQVVIRCLSHDTCLQLMCTEFKGDQDDISGTLLVTPNASSDAVSRALAALEVVEAPRAECLISFTFDEPRSNSEVLEALTRRLSNVGGLASMALTDSAQEPDAYLDLWVASEWRFSGPDPLSAHVWFPLLLCLAEDELERPDVGALATQYLGMLIELELPPHECDEAEAFAKRIANRVISALEAVHGTAIAGRQRSLLESCWDEMWSQIASVAEQLRFLATLEHADDDAWEEEEGDGVDGLGATIQLFAEAPIGASFSDICRTPLEDGKVQELIALLGLEITPAQLLDQGVIGIWANEKGAILCSSTVPLKAVVPPMEEGRQRAESLLVAYYEGDDGSEISWRGCDASEWSVVECDTNGVCEARGIPMAIAGELVPCASAEQFADRAAHLLLGVSLSDLVDWPFVLTRQMS